MSAFLFLFLIKKNSAPVLPGFYHFAAYLMPKLLQQYQNF